jgi:hypothetical protein
MFIDARGGVTKRVREREKMRISGEIDVGAKGYIDR